MQFHVLLSKSCGYWCKSYLWIKYYTKMPELAWKEIPIVSGNSEKWKRWRWDSFVYILNKVWSDLYRMETEPYPPVTESGLRVRVSSPYSDLGCRPPFQAPPPTTRWSSQSVTLSSSTRETGPEQGLHHIVCYIWKRRSKLFNWPLWFEVWPFFMCAVAFVKFWDEIFIEDGLAYGLNLSALNRRHTLTSSSPF